MSELIQRLTVDHLHIVGDIYDRGPGPHIIMDKLMDYHSVDIQWGNHDVLWMGAAAGQRGCGERGNEMTQVLEEFSAIAHSVRLMKELLPMI